MSQKVTLLVNIRDDEIHPAGTVFEGDIPDFVQYEIDNRPWNVHVEEVSGEDGDDAPKTPKKPARK